MSQHVLARQVGISEAFLSMIISSRRVPSADLRRKIAAALACDEDWVFAPVEIVGGQARAVPDARRGQAERFNARI